MNNFQHFTKQDNGESVLFFEDINLVFRAVLNEDNTIKSISYCIKEKNRILTEAKTLKEEI